MIMAAIVTVIWLVTIVYAASTTNSILYTLVVIAVGLGVVIPTYLEVNKEKTGGSRNSKG